MELDLVEYNRVKVPAEAIGGAVGQRFEYQKWGYSAGYGSFHFTQDTMSWIKFLLGRQGNRRVNSIFGEGVNPLMRKIRGALDSVGLMSDELLLHGNESASCMEFHWQATTKDVLLGLANVDPNTSSLRRLPNHEPGCCLLIGPSVGWHLESLTPRCYRKLRSIH